MYSPTIHHLLAQEHLADTTRGRDSHASVTHTPLSKSRLTPRTVRYTARRLRWRLAV